MSTTAEPPEKVDSEADSPGAIAWGWIPRLDWRAKVRWFAAEYLIVVLGVLTAVVLNAAWQDRQDRQREARYLRQLTSDLSRTLADLDEVDSAMVSREQASAKLLRAFQTPSPPPKDSLLFWLDGLIQIGRPQPVVTTAEALVASGDVRLLSDSLQVLVTEYVGFIEEFESYVDGNLARRNANMDALERHVDFVEAYRAGRRMGREHGYDEFFSPPIPEGAVRTAFPLDVAAFLGNREAYAHVRGLYSALHFMKGNRRGIRVGTQHLLERVRAAPER